MPVFLEVFYQPLPEEMHLVFLVFCLCLTGAHHFRADLN